MKYLDALCVYFWATTPVLISIMTFFTYVLLGNTLTAAKVGVFNDFDASFYSRIRFPTIHLNISEVSTTATTTFSLQDT